jgi:type II secretory pathway pseudopilin PulG
MIQNKNGFSLIELMAILFITSAIIAPLISSLVGNIEINNRSQFRRSATSIADGSLYGLNKIDFSDLRAKLDVANGTTYYVELNSDNCNTLINSSDQNLCDQLFGTIWNNLTLDSSEFKIYLFNYALTAAQETSLTGNGSIEQQVRDVIATDAEIQGTIGTGDVNDLIRVVVWIDYYDDPDQYVTLVGLVFNE